MPIIKCPECGNAISMTASACPHCGEDMEGRRAQERRRKKFLILIPLLLFSGALVLFGLLKLWNSLPPNRLPAGPRVHRSGGGVR